MKKILVLLLAVTMLLGMVACAQNAEAPAETKDTETTAPTETTQNSATSDAERTNPKITRRRRETYLAILSFTAPWAMRSTNSLSALSLKNTPTLRLTA